MTYAGDVLDGACGVQFVLFLGNGLQDRAPHQGIIQEGSVAGFRLGR